MPQAEMVMVPGENGRPAQFMTRREAELLFARNARKDQKQQDREDMELELAHSDGNSADAIIEVVEATNKVHGALTGSEGSPATSASTIQSHSSALFDPRRKEENKDRVNKIMEGRIPKKRKAVKDVDDVFRPDHKRVKTSPKPEETQLVDKALLTKDQEKDSSRKETRRIPLKNLENEASTAGKKRKATEAALKEEESNKKAKTAVDDDLIIVAKADEVNNGLQKNSKACNNNGNGSRSGAPNQKRKRVDDDDDDDDAQYQPKKVKSGVSPEQQLTTRRLAALAAYTRRTSNDNAPTEWSALHDLKPEAMDALFPFVAHNIASVAHEAIQVADHLTPGNKSSYRVVARDPAGQVIDFPAAFAVELSVVKTAFLLRKLEFLSGSAPGSLEGLGDAIFASGPSSEVIGLKRAIEVRLGMPETSLDKGDWLHDIDRKPFRLSDQITKKIRAALGVSAHDFASSAGGEGAPVPLSEVMNVKDDAGVSNTPTVGSTVAAVATADKSSSTASDNKATDTMACTTSSFDCSNSPAASLSPKPSPSSATTSSDEASVGTAPTTNATTPEPVLKKKKISFKDYLAAKKNAQSPGLPKLTRSGREASRLTPRYVMKMNMRLFTGVGEFF